METVKGYQALRKYLADALASREQNVQWAYGVLGRVQNILTSEEAFQIAQDIKSWELYWEEVKFLGIIREGGMV